MTTLARFDNKAIHKTPRGFARWPKLLIAETRFNAAGFYEIGVTFNQADEQSFLREMEGIFEDAYQDTLITEHKRELPREAPPWRKNKAGELEFRFKLKASGVFDGKPWQNKPPKL